LIHLHFVILNTLIHVHFVIRNTLIHVHFVILSNAKDLLLAEGASTFVRCERQPFYERWLSHRANGPFYTSMGRSSMEHPRMKKEG
jgi:hypothetical protein